MASKPKLVPIETENKPVPVIKERRVVRLRKGCKSNAAISSHGAYALVKAYSCGLIDRRTVIGRLIAERERAYARHHGYDWLEDCPPVLRSDIHLVLRIELFLMMFTPGPDSRTGGRELRSAENALHRIYTDWGFKPVQKRIPDLQDYLAGLETEGEGNA